MNQFIFLLSNIWSFSLLCLLFGVPLQEFASACFGLVNGSFHDVWHYYNILKKSGKIFTAFIEDSGRTNTPRKAKRPRGCRPCFPACPGQPFKSTFNSFPTYPKECSLLWQCADVEVSQNRGIPKLSKSLESLDHLSIQTIMGFGDLPVLRNPKT